MSLIMMKHSFIPVEVLGFAALLVVALTKGVWAVRYGTQAPPNDYPYVGYLEENVCSGTLITDRILLTAAHCFLVEDEDDRQQEDPHKVVVRFFINGRNVVRREIKRRILSYEQSHELTLILLNSPVAAIGPISYPQFLTRDFNKNERGTVVGFGLHLRPDMTPHSMTVGKIQFRDYEMDRTFREAVFFPAPQKRSQLPCRGDSGGPLLVSQDGELHLAGVLSHVKSVSDRAGEGMSVDEIECLNGDFAYVIPIKEHLDWIRETIHKWTP